ncbi:DJ-1/PfpI family protein [Actinopolyspora mortivallis]|uniref:Glutamine amidotransferase n=1 Tax=Actinopolyspora mortivallis TaxID=33906 RepID=A0A2T0GZZ7_ACTMO|nr:DJ-1/PfpI family protein [Actinopolyspora mortivallis]PRW64660.1 glutamine amidotransferase [Actinopolyspora mortivallis]
MRIAILLFDRFTALDAVGPYEVLSRLPDTEVVFVGRDRGTVRTEGGGLGLVADATLDEVSRPDVVVPGGPGQSEHMSDGPLHRWLRAVDETTVRTTAVCTGSLILAAAGILTGRTATSHWLALDQLSALGVSPSGERVVVDGKYVTAAGVSSGIDMALALAGELVGEDTAQRVQLGIEYDPRPPYDAGAPDKAPAEIVAALRQRSRFPRSRAV